MSILTDSAVSNLALFIEDQVRHQCARIVLAQKVGETQRPVEEWLIAEMLDARSLATEIHGTVLREALVLHELSAAYGVFAFRADSPAHVGRFVFRSEAGTIAAGTSGLGSASKPDERGVLAMLMKHIEMSARISLGHSREIVDHEWARRGSRGAVH